VKDKEFIHKEPVVERQEPQFSEDRVRDIYGIKLLNSLRHGERDWRQGRVK
jgi:hypothetical protein